MSGGVDSCVAALALTRAGRDVVGFFLRNGVSVEGPGSARSCCSVSDAADARIVAAHLGIQFYTLDVAAPFRRIVDRFVAAYREGRTPNPCVECNVDVKFGHLVGLARSVGASKVATGHYARVRHEGGRYVLCRGRDRDKDQSYVLSTLSQTQLAFAEFPLGEWTKTEVRSLAREAGLPVAEKPESQEICFVPTGDYRDLLKARGGAEAMNGERPGDGDGDGELDGEIVRTDGSVVGRHDGVSSFTIGQRRGLGVALGERYHVVRIEPATRRVVVGRRDEASARRFTIERANWVKRLAADSRATFAIDAQIRHRHLGAPAEARALDDARIEVTFIEPEFAVTPGQTAVLYDGDDVVAAGTIAEVTRENTRCVENSR